MTTTVLVAAHELRGGTKHDPAILAGGDILTKKKLKELKLGEADVQELVERGSLIETEVLDGGAAAAGGKSDGPSAAEIEATVRSAVIGEIRAVLDEQGIAHAADMDAAALVRAAIAAAAPDPIDAAVAEIETMKADEIRAELNTLQVPFETDANKPALARLLAEARARAVQA